MLFRTRQSRTPLALIVDIGSSSVGMALIKTEPELSYESDVNTSQEILWSHREFSIIHNIKTYQEVRRVILTTLMNSFLEFGISGAQVVEQHGGEVKDVQVSVSSPWSHTASHTGHIHNDTPFSINTTTVEELAKKAVQETRERLQNETVVHTAYTMVSTVTSSIEINGYKIDTFEPQTTKELNISQITVLVDSTVLNQVQDAVEKLIPKASLFVTSDMNVFHAVLQTLPGEHQECSLIIVTNETTELGIVRDNSLTYVTHTPYGSFTLAREISEMCTIPKEEAFTLLKVNDSDSSSAMNTAQQDQLEAIISAYELKISTLLKETGDSLSIPNTIFLHCSKATQTFFQDRIKAGAQITTGAKHEVYPITSKLFPDLTTKNSHLALSLKFYFAYTEPRLIDSYTDIT